MNPTVEQLLRDFVALGLGPTPAFEGESPDAYRARFFYAFGSLQGRALNALSVARIAAERGVFEVRESRHNGVDGIEFHTVRP